MFIGKCCFHPSPTLNSIIEKHRVRLLKTKIAVCDLNKNLGTMIIILVENSKGPSGRPAGLASIVN